MGAMYALTQSKLVWGAKSAKRGKLKGLICYCFFIGGQNRKIVKLRGSKLQLNL